MKYLWGIVIILLLILTFSLTWTKSEYKKLKEECFYTQMNNEILEEQLQTSHWQTYEYHQQVLLLLDSLNYLSKEQSATYAEYLYWKNKSTQLEDSIGSLNKKIILTIENNE